MNEFILINKYLKSLSKNNPGAFNLEDDIFFNKKKGFAISVDTYSEGVHFIGLDPNNFLKKIIRASLSDLYCKGINPKTYFLSFGINKKLSKKVWFSKIKRILNSEQKKFNIHLGGGDTIKSTKFIVTVIVLGYSNIKPVLRNGSSLNDDIYVTGNIGDSYLGLRVIKKKANFGKLNKFFKKKYFEPDLPTKFSPYLNKIASASIDISDGLGQDLKHICDTSNCGAAIDLNKLPLSKSCKKLLRTNKIKLKDIFSNGDDYQILFTSNTRNRSRINALSEKLNIKISKIGVVNNDKNIVFHYNGNYFKLTPRKMGYTHHF